MPARPTELAPSHRPALLLAGRRACAAAVAAVGFALLAPARAQVGPGQQLAGLGDAVQGKENNQNVFVRDSATAQEKFELAKKMERLKEWNKSADLYQEVLEKYAGRVVPSGVDQDKVINQYTSITNGVRERLCKWPAEGLDVYRGRYEPKAAALLDSAAGQGDDAFALHEVLRLYFVTDTAKAAALRMIDAKLERGEFSAAAWLGDELLTMHPNLIAERAAVLFRTALAYHLAGNSQRAADREADLEARFPKEVGVVRGKDILLVDALKQEIASEKGSSTDAASAATSDSWPMFGGNASRSLIPTGHGNAGTRLVSIPLTKPQFRDVTAPQRSVLDQQYKASADSGLTLGVMPVTDRGELFFQDGLRVFAVSLESGVPLPGWAQTYPTGGPDRQGRYSLPGTSGGRRAGFSSRSR